MTIRSTIALAVQCFALGWIAHLTALHYGLTGMDGSAGYALLVFLLLLVAVIFQAATIVSRIRTAKMSTRAREEE